MKNFFKILLVLTMFSNLLPMNVVKAAQTKQYGMEFIEKVELSDEYGKQKEQYSIHDNVKVKFMWSLPNDKDFREGDQMIIKVPKELKIPASIPMEIKESSGAIQAHALTNKSDNTVTLTFTNAVKKSDVTGYLFLTLNWNEQIVKAGNKINVSFADNKDIKVQMSSVVSPPPGPPGPEPNVYKWPWDIEKSHVGSDSNDSSIVHWRVKMNGSMKTIKDAIFTDFVGENHELIRGSISIMRGKWANHGSLIKPTHSRVDKLKIAERDSGGNQAFSIKLEDLNEEGVEISYKTKILDNFKSKSYANTAQLKGSEVSAKETKIYTPNFEMGGGATGNLGKLNIIKRDVDEPNKYLEGAIFKLIEKNSGKVIRENIRTDASGEATVSDLKYRTYKLVETKAPKGYKLDDKEVEVTISSGNNRIVTVENKSIRGSIEITKVDVADGNNKVPNAEFTIYNEQGREVVKGKTNEEGIAKFEKLPYGKYTYKETLAPEGYLINEETFSFEIKKDGEIIKQKVEDEKIPGVKTTATDKHNGAKELHTIKTVTIQDKVEYKDLLVGKEYTVKGKLMDKATNKSLLVGDKEVTAEAKLVPTEANGSILLDFTFDATGLEGKEIVVFEDLMKEGKTVATHADITDESQTVRFVKPAVQTAATDKADGTKELHTNKTVTIQDKVEYKDLLVGQEYTVKGKLMDKATNKPLLVGDKEVTAEAKLVPTEANGSIPLEFTFDATGLEEKEVVVFEDIVYADSVVATHADINDKGQTVKFVKPTVQTTATDKADGTKELHTNKTVTIQDNVVYENLVVGKEYTVKGKLMDKATNKALLVGDKEVTAEAKLVPTAANGSIPLDFTFDATGLEEKEVVVFEDIVYADSVVATHADINDKGQTVKFVKPTVQTTATDKADGTKELHTNKTVTIQDNVVYENLVVGKEYTVKGKLMDKATNKALLVGDKEVTAEAKLVPTAANGSIPLDFTFDATGLEEKEVVVFEDIVYADSVVATHADINDQGQTVKFVKPAVQTTATDKADGTKELHTNKTVTIQDNVVYENLVVGKEYTVKGKLMDKATNKALLVGDKEVTAEAKLVPTAANGSIPLEFAFDSTGLEEKKIVVFEDVWYEDIIVATHADIEDKGQTVKFVKPAVQTTATDKADGTKELHTNKTVTIQDNVVYENLVVGKEYTVKGKLMDKATNKALLVGDKEVTAEAKLVPTAANGSIPLEFAFDSTGLEEKKIVVFEDVWYEDIIVATHADIEDKGQTVKFVKPAVQTTATDKADGTKELHTNKTVTIQDNVVYENLVVGKEYTVKGKLMDKATNQPLLVGGKEVTAEAKLVPTEANGSIPLEFTFDATGLEEKEIVVFEDVWYEDTIVATHADITDKSQTVRFVKPAVQTIATNKADGTKELHATKSVTIQDNVVYENLVVGKEYTVKGKLMDKGTNQPLLVDGKEVTAEAKLVPTEANGSVPLEFTFDASELQGKEVVVFEDVVYADSVVATHADIEDKGQTVQFVKPTVKTTATNKADGSKELEASKLVTIQDKVEYTDLIVGKEYTVKGKLMDKGTNQPLLVEGREVTAEAKFTAEKKDGSITLDFTFDASELQGKEVVVFEYLLYEGNVVAVHADINDESQTVTFKVNPEQPKQPEQSKQAKHAIPQTGGSVSKLPLIGFGFVLLAGAFFVLVLARRNKK